MPVNGDNFIEQIQDVQKQVAELQQNAGGLPILQESGLTESLKRLTAALGDLQVAEEAIRLLLSAVQQSRDSIVITNALLNSPGPEIVYVNPAFSRMTGYSIEEVLGKSPRILQGEHTDRQQLDDLRYHLEIGKPYHGEAINYHKDGSEFYVEWNITPIRNAESKITHYVAIQRDITDRKQFEQEREQLLRQEQQARTQAEAANRSKDEFLAMLSHELKTPLTPILGWSKVLRTQQLPASKLQEILETIEAHARRQAQLVDDLLDLSRIVQGKLTLNLSAVDLVEPIAAALDTVCLAAEAKGIQLKTQLPTAIGSVMGDASRLQQVFWNLLSNAIKFTPCGGRVEVRLERVGEGVDGWMGGWVDEGMRGRVGEQGGEQEREQSGESSDEVHEAAEPASNALPLPPSTPSPTHSPTHPLTHSPTHPPTYAQITVTDTGQGILPDFLPYVFDRFRQEDSSISRKFSGLGLGLSIVRQLVEAHGGTVIAASAGAGQGSTFTVRLPLIPEPIAAAADPGSSTAVNLSGIRVLAVDDEIPTLQFIRFVLEQAGAIVQTVASGSGALQSLEQAEFDVLISDIGMQDMDGYRLIQQLRSLPKFQARPIPAIALTAYTSAHNQQEALAAGYQMHLAKPFDPEDLIQAVAKQIPLH